jgi:hypothetical protein
MAYAVHKCTGSGATLDNFKFRPTFWFELRHDDGTVARQTAHYFVDGLTGRQVNGYRLQMAKLLPRYEAYLAKTGNRIAWLKKHIPIYTAELEELTRTKEVPA